MYEITMSLQAFHELHVNFTKFFEASFHLNSPTEIVHVLIYNEYTTFHELQTLNGKKLDTLERQTYMNWSTNKKLGKLGRQT